MSESVNGVWKEFDNPQRRSSYRSLIIELKQRGFEFSDGRAWTDEEANELYRLWWQGVPLFDWTYPVNGTLLGIFKRSPRAIQTKLYKLVAGYGRRRDPVTKEAYDVVVDWRPAFKGAVLSCPFHPELKRSMELWVAQQAMGLAARDPKKYRLMNESVDILRRTAALLDKSYEQYYDQLCSELKYRPDTVADERIVEMYFARIKNHQLDAPAKVYMTTTVSIPMLCDYFRFHLNKWDKKLSGDKK